MFSSNRLEIARKRRKLTQNDLAKKIGIEARTIRGYERCEYEPANEILVKIASVLDFPVEWFQEEDLFLPMENIVSFRSLARMSAGNRNAALAAGSIGFIFNKWVEKRYTLPKLDVPFIDSQEPEAVAESLRRKWGIGELPIKNMIHLLESKGIRVFSMSEDTLEVDAYSFWKDGVPFIFLNTKKTTERSRFDAAHELGHLVMHRHNDSSGKNAEREANSFASAFLMPKGGMLANSSFFAAVELERLIELKKHWLVSISALIYRLHSLKILKEARYRSLYIQLSQRGYRTNEPNTYPREMSLTLTQIFRFLQKEGISKEKIAAELRIPVEEINNLIFGMTITSISEASFVSQSKERPASYLRVIK
ncbi:ImmA/IrrE family metallo-endopeptidase [Entomobacter blattae]|uniref:HTH cro/C1-type domain-containing protein n=1 Tax=Entomobacter blattae TaxID=2762277 RepID=A0A7H1NUD2_9PROT|nr:ImmA/IrrE family metallo-endopeptidase [Entomobacter blattae]QNT79392.1 hypothetical protein JGUZn3_21910 [Entomobacter blattae]